MLEELSVRQLGVIDELSLTFAPHLTAVTGETGAGKTLVVEAIELLVGGRADSRLVRPGATEARVDGRFRVPGGDEVVISRVVPRDGRSRAYLDGRPASQSELAELGATLVDLQGQHAQQSLLAPAAQRDALDRYAGIDPGPRRAARAELRRLEAELAACGGDDASRARQRDFLRFQLDELDAARLEDGDEDERLEAEEALLGDALAHQEAGAAAYAALSDDGGASDALASAIGLLGDRTPFADLVARARGLAAELTDVAGELRGRAEAIEPDPERLAWVQQRRQLLRDLHRKYADLVPDAAAGAARAAALLAVQEALSAELEQLEGHGERVAALEGARAEAAAVLAAEEARVLEARRAAAPQLGAATAELLAQLAMPRVRFDVEVEGPDMDTDADAGARGAGAREGGRVGGGSGTVTFLLAANPGAPLLPLSKVASGGELSRVVLALRLALDAAGPTGGGVATGAAAGGPNGSGGSGGPGGPGGPATMIFDEVDAGIGGQAASAVGAALARLAADRQVLVVTHLAQVAAWGDAQVTVTKEQDAAGTSSQVRALDGEARVVELARMLSGSPESASAREHAAELLAAGRRGSGDAAVDRGAGGPVGVPIDGSANGVG